MNRRITITIIALSLLLGVALWSQGRGVKVKAASTALSITVNTTADTADANPGDGVCADANGNCSLRAAISEANALAGDDTIALPAGTYTQSLAGANENVNAGGDWDIASNLIIAGAGSGTTIVQAAATAGTATERVLHVVSGTVELRDLTLQHGKATSAPARGGGLFNAGTLTLTRVAVRENLALGDNDDANGLRGQGGGIYNNGVLAIQNSALSNNTAQGGVGFIGGDGEGGGIANAEHRSLTVSGSTFTGNTAQGGASSDSFVEGYGQGGGARDSNVHGDTGSLSFTNCTFSNNSANAGGAMWVGAATVTLINSTVSHNTASREGGGLLSSAGLTAAGPFLQSTIIANNTALFGPDLFYNFRSLDYNLIGNPSGATFNGSTSTAHDLTGVDPALGALANNGGPTQTRLPGAASPALNVIPNGVNGCGSTITTDQRGVARPFPSGGSCDVGAVEAANTAPTASCKNVTVSAGASCTAYVSIDDGSFDSDSGDTITGAQSPAGPYPLGTTTVTLTVTDSHGASSSCSAVVTVADNTVPTISLNGANPMTVECPYGFTDPGAAAQDNCAGSVAVTKSGSVNTAVPGSYTITYSANDGVNTATRTRTVNVVDSVAPTLTLKPNISLWPPDHGYRTVTMSQMVQSVSDGCNTTLGIGSVVIEKVTSDEPDNAPGGSDGATTNDIVIAADCRSVQLRAERDETKNGRVYVITLRVRDASGNTTKKDFKVSVPINQSGAAAVQDAAALTKTSSCP